MAFNALAAILAEGRPAQTPTEPLERMVDAYFIVRIVRAQVEAEYARQLAATLP